MPASTEMAPVSPPMPVLPFAISSSISSFNVPVKVHLSLHKEYDAIAGAALIFDSKDRLLVLQRAGHDSMPHLWEIPGGACDLEDETILHGVAREVWEESGLVVSALGQQVDSGNDHVFFSRRGLKICKYTFEAEVVNTEAVKLDPNEHQNYLWVTEEQCRDGKVETGRSVLDIKFTTPAQEAIIYQGFRLRNETRSREQ